MRIRERLHRFKFSWNFTQTVLGHGRIKSLRQAIGNFRHLPSPSDNHEVAAGCPPPESSR